MPPDPIGIRLKQYRRRRSLTQDQLADAAKVTQVLISQLESGARQGERLHVNVAKRLAGALGIGLEALVGSVVEEELAESEACPAAKALVAS